MKCLVCCNRDPERPQVCDGCRVWLPGVLRDIAESYAQLVAAEQDEPARILVEDDGGWDAPAVYDVHALPAGPIRVPMRGGHVSGSREAPVPVLLDVVDLTAPARLPNPARGPGYYPRSLWPEDQIGHQSVATRLDLWVRDWLSYPWCPGDHLPDATVSALVRWLTVRCDLACDKHPAANEFAGEMRELRAVLRRANDDGPVYPEILHGVPCSRCDCMPLHRDPESAYYAECASCGQLYTETEYTDWVGLMAASVKRSTA